MSADPVAMLAGVGLLLVCCSSSSLIAGMMGGGKTVEETASEPSKSDSGDSGDSGVTEDKTTVDSSTAPEPYADWRVEDHIDYPGNDIFHYWPGHATTKASKEVCLTKCKEMSNCKLVTFNNDKTLCWGKSTAANKRAHGDRNNYFKP
jgi:hypothetical protein